MYPEDPKYVHTKGALTEGVQWRLAVPEVRQKSWAGAAQLPNAMGCEGTAAMLPVETLYFNLSGNCEEAGLSATADSRSATAALQQTCQRCHLRALYSPVHVCL